MKPVRVFALVLIAALAVRGEARQIYQLGGVNGVSWSAAGALEFIDTETVPNGIQPLETEISTNLIPSMQERGGGMTSLVDQYTLPINWKVDGVLVVDGDPTTAFVHPPRINFFATSSGVPFYTFPMFFDLGAPFPVERIRFSTRSEFPGRKMRQYRLYTNDGDEESRNDRGNPIWSLVRDETDNLNAVVDLNIEPRLVRHLYLYPVPAGETWEVAEFEVYGRGFAPRSAFLSDPIDMQLASSLGRIWWRGGLDPDAKILIQTRSGDDEQPEIYWRKTGVGDEEVPFGTNGRPMTRSQYEGMPLNLQGKITQDLANWSVWQTYEYADGQEGTRILSPSPRRYLQLRADFFSSGSQGGKLDSLFFEYSQSPVINAAIGEIYPNSVNPAEPVSFTYAVRTRLDPGQVGFNSLEVRTQARLEGINAVRIDRENVDFSLEFDPADPHRFSVTFPRIDRDQTLLEVDFDARVFVYGTSFSGSVVDADLGEVPQEVTPGDAVAETPSDALIVRTAFQGNLLSPVEATPNPFSPNGDGINDQMQIAYSLLRLTDTAPVEAEVYNLAGQRVRSLSLDSGTSALYRLVWDGRDDGGEMAAPGLYILRIAVKADGGVEEKLKQIALVY